MAIGIVILDTENVYFEGDPPGSISELWTLIENYLGQSNRVIDQFSVDGIAWDPSLIPFVLCH